MRQIVVIGAVPRMSHVVFLAKLERLLRNYPLEYEFWGWVRERETPTEATRVLLQGGGEANRKLLLWYPLWMSKVFLAVLMHRGPAQFFCLDFSTAFPVAVASLFKDCTYVFADADSISKSHRWPAFLKKLLEVAEGFVARRACIHLVPAASRISHADSNVRLVANTPLSETLRAAREYAVSHGYEPDSRLTLYVNGWLTGTRGLSTLVSALRSCPDVRVLVAGRINSSEAKQLVDLPNVCYLGRLSEEQALAAYSRCHIAFTFYDPAIEINRLAEPNKWMDCLVTGTPFLTNSEVQTARPFIERDACFAIPYHDSDGLAQLLSKLSQDRAELDRVRLNLSAMPCPPLWDIAMRDLLGEIVECHRNP